MSERDDVSEADLSEPFTNEDAAKLGRFVADFGAWQAVFNRLAIATPAELESRAAAAEAALAVAQDALESIHSESGNGGDPGMLRFWIHVTARDALEKLGVLPTPLP